MMVIFLTGLVAMILARTLRNDYAKYTRETDDLESLERDLNEESGWKLCHGDAFRPPARLELLAALIGTGVQLAQLILAVILITIAGKHTWPACRPITHSLAVILITVAGEVCNAAHLAALIVTNVQMALLILAFILIVIAGEHTQAHRPSLCA